MKAYIHHGRTLFCSHNQKWRLSRYYRVLLTFRVLSKLSDLIFKMYKPSCKDYPTLTFSLPISFNKQAITPNGNLFDHLYESNYTMTIKDSKNCVAYKDIQLNGKKPEDCETLVIAFEDNKSNYLSFE